MNKLFEKIIFNRNPKTMECFDLCQYSLFGCNISLALLRHGNIIKCRKNYIGIIIYKSNMCENVCSGK